MVGGLYYGPAAFPRPSILAMQPCIIFIWSLISCMCSCIKAARSSGVFAASIFWCISCIAFIIDCIGSAEGWDAAAAAASAG